MDDYIQDVFIDQEDSEVEILGVVSDSDELVEVTTFNDVAGEDASYIEVEPVEDYIVEDIFADDADSGNEMEGIDYC